jgi:hypothetical protein
MIEQQKDIQSLLSTPPSNKRQETARLPIYNPMGILSAAVPSQPSYSFFPSKQTALKLWNAYIERIEGCSGIKLLHIPTDEARLCATMESPADAQPEDLALCYAVFFAAMAVMHPTEAQALVQQHEEDAATVQARCKIGLEQALTEAEVLDKPTLPLLCALALYLSALQLHNRGKGIWVLNGLAIRIAQGMGLHRDGERLGLSPFQSELRRRVWWHIISRDGRAAEDYGLQRFCNMRTDAGLPLHVDDTDLHPDMTALPRARVGTYTAMTLPLVNFAIARAMRRLSSVAAAATPASPPEESARVQIIQEAKQRVDELLAGCNPVIPRHRLALLASRLAIRKADLVSRQQWLALAHHHHSHHNHNGNDNAESDSSSKEAFATDENLAEALDVLDLTLQMWNDEMLKPYSWLWKTNPEYHVVMYLLWHLCVRPPEREPNVSRAWSMVDRWFAESREIIGEEGEAEGSGSNNKGAILVALRRKAALMREASVGREAGTGAGSEWRGRTRRDDMKGGGGGGGDLEQSANLPPAIPHNQEQQPPLPWGDDTWGPLRRMSMGVGLENEAWTTDLDQVPDWGAFIQAFQFDGQNLPGMTW